jgi:hypothetical protein
MSEAVRCVVFSFDRPMQLDATLTSMRRHVGDAYGLVTVLYRSSSRRFAAGYVIARETHPDVEWLEERDFRSDLLSIVDTEGLVVFHTDDDVFFAEVEPFTLHEDEVCFSFRLGLNVSYSYALDRPEHVDLPIIRDDRLSWAWRSQPAGSFSYPLAVNGHVLRASELRPLIETIPFSDPNELESGLHARREGARPRMASFTTSRVLSIPANVVTRSIRNRHGGLHTPAELNERFLAGERIATERMAFGAVTSCHEEIPFAYRTASDPPTSGRRALVPDVSDPPH